MKYVGSMNVTVVMAIILLLSVLFAMSALGAMPSHMDKAKNPAGCAGCHRGHGKRGTMMLTTEKKDLCLSCHGIAARSSATGASSDIESVLSKMYKHPIKETSQYHSPLEDLPEKNVSAPRHVACEDCHMVHSSEKGEAMKNASGFIRAVRARRTAREEYEVCFKCHSDSANLRMPYKNKADEFDPGNASFHPVTSAGKGHYVPSLKPPYDVSSHIKCTDCHGNSDSFGPKGPHGSDFEFILKKQYIMTETAEGPFAYDLCYSCHDRQSILRNESFKKHQEHVVFFHIPCIACHASHGSRSNKGLMEFRDSFARPSPLPTYAPSNNGRPLCYITCHVGGRDVIHDTAFYTTRMWP